MISDETIAQLIVRKIIDYNGIGSYVFGVCGAEWYLAGQDLSNAVNNKSLKYC